MAGRPLARAGVALGVLTITTAPVNAYVRTTTDQAAPVRWPATCVTIIVHAAEPPQNVTRDLFVGAARAAAAAWSRGEVACTDLELQIAVSEGTSTALVKNDGRNNMVFRKREWCKEPRSADERCYDSAALAITTVFALQADGKVLDADVELNAVNFTWGDLVANPMATEPQDLQNTLTHELGHLLGLDHNCYAGGPRDRPLDHASQPVPDCSRASRAVQDATMYAAVRQGDVLRRTLAEDDIAGVCGVYPAMGAAMCAAPVVPPPPIDGDTGCSMVRAPATEEGPASALMTMAAAFGLGLMARSRRTFRARRSRSRRD